LRYVFFTKTLRDLAVPALIEALRDIGADGADLCVRDGYPVNPANVRRVLPGAARRFHDAGLTVAMVTAPTDLHDPAGPQAEALFGGCHDAGVPYVKPGYWAFRPGPFAPQLDAARKELAGWQKLAQRFGVRCCVHIHSGNYLTINTSAALLLVSDTAPEQIGIYLDPGHLALNGEPAPMAVSMAGRRLSLIAAKDLMWERTGDGRVRRVTCKPLGEGFVDWRQWMHELAAARFEGAVSFHSEYEGLTDQQMMERARLDILYLRGVAAEIGARPA
jgi:sugar phosphate isomerase/epimerase